VATLYSYYALLKVRAPSLLTGCKQLDAKRKELFLYLDDATDGKILLEYLYQGSINF